MSHSGTIVSDDFLNEMIEENERLNLENERMRSEVKRLEDELKRKSDPAWMNAQSLSIAIEELHSLRAEIERLRDLLAFNGIDPDAKVESAKGARFQFDPAWVKAHKR